MTRKLRPALELVSAIGSLGFDLQHHSDTDIADAVELLRKVNPEMFDFIWRVLAAPKVLESIREMRLVSDSCDESSGTSSYQMHLVALALISREFLRRVPAVENVK